VIYPHPCFVEQVERLHAQVKRDEQKDPKNYISKAPAKTLKAIHEIVLSRIPDDPTNKRYRLGFALGDDYKHWSRDKFGNGRFRLFFRCDSDAKVILYIWVNDENSKRTYGSKTDAYAVFRKMLESGNPPDSWEELVEACKDPTLLARLKKIFGIG
jgi:toxin YhaV